MTLREISDCLRETATESLTTSLTWHSWVDTVGTSDEVGVVTGWGRALFKISLSTEDEMELVKVDEVYSEQYERTAIEGYAHDELKRWVATGEQSKRADFPEA